MAIVSKIVYPQLENRFDAEYYKPEYLEVERTIKNYPNKKAIGKLAEIVVNGTEIREYVPKGTPYLRVSDAREIFLDLSDVKYVRENVEVKKDIELDLNDLLFSRSGTIGVVGIVTEDIKGAIISSHLIRVKLRSINPYFAVVFFNSKYGILQILRRNNGTVVPEINQPALKSIVVPIPPPSSQEHIEKLVKEAHEKRKLADQKYKEAEQLLYKELGIGKLELTREKTFETTFSEVEKTTRFDSEYYQPKYDQNIENVRNSKFKNVKLGTLIEGIKYGTSEKVDYSESGIPFLRVTDINSFNTIDIEDIKRIPEYELQRVKNAIIRENEILISRTGTIGCAVYINEKLKNSIFGSYFIKIKVDKINPLYLSIFLNSQLGKLQTQRETSGAIQTNITIPIIKSLRIIVPDTEIQEKICDVYRDALQIRDASRRLIVQAKTEVEELIEKGR